MRCISPPRVLEMHMCRSIVMSAASRCSQFVNGFINLDTNVFAFRNSFWTWKTDKLYGAGCWCIVSMRLIYACTLRPYMAWVNECMLAMTFTWTICVHRPTKVNFWHWENEQFPNMTYRFPIFAPLKININTNVWEKIVCENKAVRSMCFILKSSPLCV